MNIKDELVRLSLLDESNNRIKYKQIKKLQYLVDEIMNQTNFADSDTSLMDRVRCIMQGFTTLPRCAVCNTPLKISSKITEHCSPSCGARNPVTRKKRYATTLERHGVEQPLQSEYFQQKRTNTNIERYGVEYPMQSSEVQTKAKDTHMERYGVEYPMQLSSIKSKTQDTNMERYGVAEPLQSPIFQKKRSLTMMKRYGVEHPIQSKQFRDKMISTNMERYGTMFHTQSHLPQNTLTKLKDVDWLTDQHHNLNETLTDIAHNLECSPSAVCRAFNALNITVLRFGQSKDELELLEYIKSTLPDEEVISGDRIILNGMELDVYIPTRKIAFEFNGIFWHSELCGKDNNYHINKTEACSRQGVKLIHISENDWKYNNESTKRKVLNYLNVNITQPIELYEVLVIGLTYSLLLQGEIIQYITFKNTDIDSYEITNCSTNNNAIGMVKLFNSFVSDHNPTQVIAHTDVDSSMDTYHNIGMVHISRSKPTCKYFYNPSKLISEQEYKKLKLPHDNSKTEWDNCINNGYNRIWDCGYDTYKWPTTN